MTGSEMHKILKKTGIKGKELAVAMGFPTASRVYKASNSGSSDVQTIYDLAFEKILGKGRFKSLLEKIREERRALRMRSQVVVRRPEVNLKKAGKENERKSVREAEKVAANIIVSNTTSAAQTEVEAQPTVDASI